MDEPIRTFIAIELSPSLQEAFKKIQTDLAKLNDNIKWVKPQNIHLTLRFLGNISRKKVKAINEKFATFFTDQYAFEVNVGSVGGFPNLRRPRVIWAGITKNTEQVHAVAASVEHGLNILGFPKDPKKFKAHMTLGRVRSPKNLKELTKELETYNLPTNLNQTITTITFYRSTLTPQGPIYTALTTHRLPKK